MIRRFLNALRERWGGGIRPSVSLGPAYVERWDGEGEGPARCVTFEGFGWTGLIFIGRTPPRDERQQEQAA